MQLFLVLCILGLLSLSEQSKRGPQSTLIERVVKKPAIGKTFLDKLHTWVEHGMGRRELYISSNLKRDRANAVCGLWSRAENGRFVGPYEGHIVQRGAPSSDQCTDKTLVSAYKSHIPEEVQFDDLFRTIRTYFNLVKSGNPTRTKEIEFVLDAHVQTADNDPIRLAGDGFDSMINESVEVRDAVVAAATQLVLKYIPGFFPTAAEESLTEDQMKEAFLMFPSVVSQISGIREFLSWLRLSLVHSSLFSPAYAFGRCLDNVAPINKLPKPVEFFIVASASMIFNEGMALAVDSSIIAGNLDHYFSLVKCDQ